MRSKQSLVVIDEATLAFTRPEAIALFESYGLSADQASLALDHTHGRASTLDESAQFPHESGLTRTGTRDRVEGNNNGNVFSADHAFQGSLAD